MLVTVPLKFRKLALYVLVCGTLGGVVSDGASAAPIAPISGQETPVPVLAFPACKASEIPVEMSLLHQRLETLKVQLKGSRREELQEEVAAFLSAAPSLTRGSCMAIESASQPAQGTLDELFKDYLGRTAMYEWKHHSGIYGTLKKSGARAHLSCRVAAMSPADISRLSGERKPTWDYCCRIDLCVGALSY